MKKNHMVAIVQDNNSMSAGFSFITTNYLYIVYTYTLYILYAFPPSPYSMKVH